MKAFVSATDRLYVIPTSVGYQATEPMQCFRTEADAEHWGYRRLR